MDSTISVLILVQYFHVMHVYLNNCKQKEAFLKKGFEIKGKLS